MSAFRDIWVVIERFRGNIHPVSLELLSKARELNKTLKQKIVAVVFGTLSEESFQTIKRYGSDVILQLFAKDDNLKNELDSNYSANSFVKGNPSSQKNYGLLLKSSTGLRFASQLFDYDNVEFLSRVALRAIEEFKPLVILCGATSFGRVLMPLIAVGVQTGLTADCTDLKMDGELLLSTRPAFGGNIMAVIVCEKTRPQMATVRPHVFKSIPLDNFSEVQHSKEKNLCFKVVVRYYKMHPFRTAKVVKTISEETEIDISEADVIVSGGRGLGGPDGFKLLEKLASKIGGVIGASRGAVDLGWISHAHQVGQTGKTVSPKLYIACGISGAVQHITGMKGAEKIIAINEDPEAPIFDYADYGIVGNLYEVIPRIISEL